MTNNMFHSITNN